MIILLGNGRLGNQLFQYSFIKKAFPTELAILVGFDESAELCYLNNSIVVPKKYFGKITYKVFRGAIALLSTLRLISRLEEDTSGSEFKIIKTYGLFFNILLIRNSFFQHEKFTENLPNDLEIKGKHLERARFLISEMLSANPNRELVFIHIRRGDYVEWPSSTYPAVISAAWIFKAVNYFKNKLSYPIFLIFTDDRQYVEDIFLGKDDFVILKQSDPIIDLAIMSLCDFGILSASTFSWWAANFSRKRNSKTLNNEFIAPNFWAGHASSNWFPPNFYTKWLTYLSVK